MSLKAAIKIGERTVGVGRPTLVIAEAGVNHNGRLDLAMLLVDAAADSGADAIKFQTFRADSLVTHTAPKAAYQVRNTGNSDTQMAMLRELELGNDVWARLQAHAVARGLLFLSTPFDNESADMLAELDVPAFKLSSGDLTNLPFLRHVGRLRRPIVASTGMANLAEVETALDTLTDAGATEVALLHCVSCYPADPADSNLRAMDTMRMAFGVPVGYSDHTIGAAIPIAAVARGAVLIEKHITLSRSMSGPDHAASSDPAEFGMMTRAIRDVETAIGNGRKKPVSAELLTARAARRSIVAGRDIAEGAILAEDDLVMRRPGTGLPSSMVEFVIGRRARCAISAGDLLSLDMLT